MNGDGVKSTVSKREYEGDSGIGGKNSNIVRSKDFPFSFYPIPVLSMLRITFRDTEETSINS